MRAAIHKGGAINKSGSMRAVAGFSLDGVHSVVRHPCMFVITESELNMSLLCGCHDLFHCHECV